MKELQNADGLVRKKIVYLRDVTRLFFSSVQTFEFQVPDYQKLEDICNESDTKRITVIGDGLLGTELAYSIKRKYPKLDVHQVELFSSSNSSVPFSGDKRVRQFAENPPERAVRIGQVRARIQRSQNPLECENSRCRIGKRWKGHFEGKFRDSSSSSLLFLLFQVSGEDLESDAIVVAIGIEPNVELAKDAGLKVKKEKD